jgi:hypothetical protein
VSHTPGPWKYNGLFVTANGELPLFRYGIAPEETEANAILISAAPDLLAACEAFLEAWTGKKGYTEREMEHATNLAIRAIDKARGEAVPS